jgi:hypothetical protein
MMFRRCGEPDHATVEWQFISAYQFQLYIDTHFDVDLKHGRASSQDQLLLIS